MSSHSREPREGRSTDHVRARRARIARAVKIAKRVGYTALAGAIATFFVGLATGLPSWTAAATILLLVVAIVVLPIPIVLGYGIRAAEREDRSTPPGGSSTRRPAP